MFSYIKNKHTLIIHELSQVPLSRKVKWQVHEFVAPLITFHELEDILKYKLLF